MPCALLKRVVQDGASWRHKLGEAGSSSEYGVFFGSNTRRKVVAKRRFWVYSAALIAIFVVISFA
jgi:hypothetical protein